MLPTVVSSSDARRLSSSWVVASILTLVLCMHISIHSDDSLRFRNVTYRRLYGCGRPAREGHPLDAVAPPTTMPLKTPLEMGTALPKG